MVLEEQQEAVSGLVNFELDSLRAFYPSAALIWAPAESLCGLGHEF